MLKACAFLLALGMIGGLVTIPIADHMRLQMVHERLDAENQAHQEHQLKFASR